MGSLMATIETLVNRILTRLFMVSGLDVQVHAEDQIVDMLRSSYNELFEKVWWRYNTFAVNATLDGTTGQIVEDLSSSILRFKDINSIYYDLEETPLPQLTPSGRLSEIRTRCYAPNNSPKLFTFYPQDETGQVTIWYRTWVPDAVWDNNQFTTELNFDSEVLMYSVMMEFLAVDDSNQTAAKLYAGKFRDRLNELQQQQWQAPFSKRNLERDGPLTRWE